MIIYTEEQFKTLQKYEGKLYNALYLNYVRINDSDLVKDLDQISQDVSGIGITGGCSHCLMNHIKRLAKPYFDQKALREKRAELEKAAKAAAKEALNNNTKNTTKDGQTKKGNGGKKGTSQKAS